MSVLLMVVGVVITCPGLTSAQDRTISFSTSATGESKAIDSWGLDTAWLSEANIRRGVAFMGASRVDVVRISFTPTSALVNGELQEDELATLNERLDLVDLTGTSTVVCINEDSPSIDSYFKPDDDIITSRWADLIDVTAAHAQDDGRTVVSVAPFNEPDYLTEDNGSTMAAFYDVAGELLNKSRFASIRLSGGNTLSTDNASTWYNYLEDRLDEGNTHQLAGSFDNYAAFYQTVVANGHHATNDELHNVVEAIVGAEYGLQTGIWWGTAGYARGEFVKASDGQRLGYAEHRDNWTAACVYRTPSGQIQAFGGASERQAVDTTYRLVCTDRDVFFDGHGPQRSYDLFVPGGNGYWVDQPNAERVVNITWGDDVQPVIDGNYVLVNCNSGKVLEVADANTADGANIQQNTYDGGLNQCWTVTPQDSRVGGDYSYFKITAQHSGKAIDVYDYSLDNGGNIAQWTLSGDGGSENQQWYLEYVGDGYFYLRSRYNAKCLEVANASTADEANIQQWDEDGGLNQQWRLLPIGAAIEFVAPAAPTGVAAVANAASVQVSWTANSESDLAGYTVLRSTTSGGSYEIIARDVTTTSYTDNGASQTIPYYYVVKAVDESLNRSANSSQVTATPTGASTLIAQYDFDGDVSDSVGTNDGTVTGSPSYVTGQIDQAIDLDGSDDLVTLPSGMMNVDDVTIAAWVNWDGSDNWQRVFDFGNDTTEYLFLTPSSGSSTLRFAISEDSYNDEQVMETTSMSTGQWVHVAVTLSGNTGTLYVDGSAVATNTSMTLNPSTFNPIYNYIGQSQYADPLFNGQIDDFRVYNYALSSSAVATLATVTTTVATPIAWYEFEGDADDSEGSNDGSTTGNPSYVTGVVGQAIDLDGSNDIVTLPSGLLDVEDATIATWVYWDGGSSWQRIFDFGNDSTEYLFLSPSSGGSTLRFAITTNSYWSEQTIETTALSTGEWVHVAVTLNGDTGTLYVDGSAAANNTSMTLDPEDFDPSNNLIGDSQYSADPLFSGAIDDFRIYDEALSSSEISTLASE